MKHLLLLILIFTTIILSANAQIISTVAGNGTAGYSGDGGQASATEINLAYHITIDKGGYLYIADHDNHRVRKVAPNGVITTIAGNGIGGYSGDNGPATAAELYYPAGVSLDSSGNLYIADAGNMVVRKVDINGKITTFAGTHNGGYNGDSIPAASAELFEPNDVFADAKTGNVYIADTRSNRIRKVTPNGIITTVGGTGVQGYGGDGGQATSALFSYPEGLFVDRKGNIYIADYTNHRVRKISANGVVTTIAGTGIQGYSGDGGLATVANLNVPCGIYADSLGNVYFADTYNYRIRKIDVSGIITTIAGTGVAGFSGDGGPATSAQLNVPMAVFPDAAGNLFISDRNNYRIRKIVYAIPAITSFSPASGGTGSSIVITGTNLTGATAVSFGGVKAAAFTVNSSTKITARVGSGASGSVSVTTPGGTVTLAGFTYCLTPSVKITANITSPFCAGTPVKFTATPVNGGTAPVYQWLKNGLAVGTDSSSYSDSALKTSDTVICKLTSNASPCVTTSTVSSNKLTFTVNPVVTPSVSIVATPGSFVCAGTNVLFTATPVNGGTSPAYQWMKNGINAGANSTTYTDSLVKDGDSVAVKLTSNAACPATTAATGNVIKLTVNTPAPVVNITANKDTTICSSTAVTFTATVNPVYLWKKDGIAVGNSTNIYKDSLLKNGDNVQCFLVSSASACNTNASNIINSNKLKFVVNSAPAKPSAISGPANVKIGQQGVYFSVTAVAGVTYAWTLPSGSLIDSGQGGNKIKVDWGTIGGNVSVIGINNCGSSLATSKTVGVVPALTGTIKSSTTDNSIEVSNEVKLYPNPAGASTTLQFTSNLPGKYVITVLDAQNKVLEIKNGMSVKGGNTVKINTAKYAKGIYFITITTKENGQRSKKLVISETKY